MNVFYCRVKNNYIAVGDVKMKKLILSLMLVMIFLSFSNDKGVSRHDFNDLKLRTEASYKNKLKSKIMLTNVFDDNRLLFNDKDVYKHDFGDLKLKTEAGYNREEQKRKRKVMLTNVFNN